jgi:hypothetical protein
MHFHGDTYNSIRQFFEKYVSVVHKKTPMINDRKAVYPAKKQRNNEQFLKS